MNETTSRRGWIKLARDLGWWVTELGHTDVFWWPGRSRVLGAVGPVVMTYQTPSPNATPRDIDVVVIDRCDLDPYDYSHERCFTREADSIRKLHVELPLYLDLRAREAAQIRKLDAEAERDRKLSRAMMAQYSLTHNREHLG